MTSAGYFYLDLQKMGYVQVPYRSCACRESPYSSMIRLDLEAFRRASPVYTFINIYNPVAAVLAGLMVLSKQYGIYDASETT